jgi:hypothetical protein
MLGAFVETTSAYPLLSSAWIFLCIWEKYDVSSELIHWRQQYEKYMFIAFYIMEWDSWRTRLTPWLYRPSDHRLSAKSVTTYKSFATRWALLVSVLLRLLVDDVSRYDLWVCVGICMMVLGLSTRTWDSVLGLNGLCFNERCSSLKKSLDHTLFKIIYLVYFSPLHNCTQITVHN